MEYTCEKKHLNDHFHALLIAVMEVISSKVENNCYKYGVFIPGLDFFKK